MHAGSQGPPGSTTFWLHRISEPGFPQLQTENNPHVPAYQHGCPAVALAKLVAPADHRPLAPHPHPSSHTHT